MARVKKTSKTTTKKGNKHPKVGGLIKNAIRRIFSTVDTDALTVIVAEGTESVDGYSYCGESATWKSNAEKYKKAVGEFLTMHALMNRDKDVLLYLSKLVPIAKYASLMEQEENFETYRHLLVPEARGSYDEAVAVASGEAEVAQT